MPLPHSVRSIDQALPSLFSWPTTPTPCVPLLCAVLCAWGPTAAVAEKLGDHPAVVIKRLQDTKGYDYAAKFYPHPAWLYLLAEAPRRNGDHPAVVVFKRQEQAATEMPRLALSCAAETSH